MVQAPSRSSARGSGPRAVLSAAWRLRRPLLAGSSLLLVLAIPAAAQEGSGFGIVSESGRPIVGAPVVVDGAQTLITDEDGCYFGSLSPGQHQLTVALHGYRPLERSVTVEADRTTTADFVLEPVLQVAAASLPASLARGTPGLAQVFVTNTASSAYSLDAAGLSFLSDGTDRSADFLVQPDPANPTEVQPGETVMMTFTLTPAAAAAMGWVTLQASLFTFDTALGKNLILNSSLERVDAAGSAPPWFFAIDNRQFFPGASGDIVTNTAMTGRRGFEVRVPAARPGDVRAYWDNDVPIGPSRHYVLSGYVKTKQVASDPGFGAAVYVPITGNLPHQEPGAPWIDGTRDWRKAMIAFETTANGRQVVAHCRGEIQQGTGIAWFDNLALTEGSQDGSLTVTSTGQTLEVTAE